VRSIQTKLTVMILTVFVVALSALGGLNYFKASTILTGKITQEMATTATAYATGVTDWLEARKSELTVMSVAPVVQSGNREAMVPFLNSAVKVNKAYNGISYANLQGDYIHSSGVTGNVAHRAYFQTALNGDAAISDPLISGSTGQLVTVIAVPIKTDRKVVGVLYGAVDMAGLAQRVLAIKVGQTGYAFVAQGDGLRIIHPDSEIAMKYNPLQDPEADPGQRQVSEQMINGGTGTVTYSFNGGNRYYAFAPVHGTKWSLATTVPVEEATSEISALTVISLVTIVVVLLLAAIVIAWYARRIAGPIQQLEIAARRIAGGDISQIKLGITSQDELGRLGQSFEQMTGNLRSLINKILGVTEKVATSAEELAANTQQSVQAANQVAAAVVQTAEDTDKQLQTVDKTVALVERIAAGAQQGAAKTSHAVELSRQAVTVAAEGNAAVDNSSRQMNSIQVTVDDLAGVVAELGEHSEKIGEIVETIANIAGQTNMLALNAAIEAARAGEHGRGFAVVAEEVRKLAENSQEAARQIASLISEIRLRTDLAVTSMSKGTTEVRKGIDVVDKAGASFQNIAAQVKEVASLAQEAADNQAGLEEISGRVLGAVREVDTVSRKFASQAQSISASTEEQLVSLEEIASSSKVLANSAEELRNAIKQFNI
jgi:methyl-accepting chemotaxis protein